MKSHQIAAQLYTCRDLIKTPAGLTSTLRRLRDIGYTAAQASATGHIPVGELRSIFNDEGMTCCATHEPSTQIRREPEAVIAHLRSLGCAITAYPHPDEPGLMSDPARLAHLIEDLEASAKLMAAEGITLTYHNHAIEFVQIGGVTALDRIYSGAPHLQGELDTYWVQYGGGDPVAWCRKLAGRLPVLHLKDYAYTPADKPAFAEIGSGNLDFKSIIAAAEASGCKWFIVEQDTTPGDPVDSLKMSFDYLSANICEPS